MLYTFVHYDGKNYMKFSKRGKIYMMECQATPRETIQDCKDFIFCSVVLLKIRCSSCIKVLHLYKLSDNSISYVDRRGIHGHTTAKKNSLEKLLEECYFLIETPKIIDIDSAEENLPELDVDDVTYGDNYYMKWEDQDGIHLKLTESRRTSRNLYNPDNKPIKYHNGEVYVNYYDDPLFMYPKTIKLLEFLKNGIIYIDEEGNYNKYITENSLFLLSEFIEEALNLQFCYVLSISGGVKQSSPKSSTLQNKSSQL